MYFLFENTMDCHASAFDCYYKIENMVQVKLNVLI